jgi:hypothetical protein
MAAQHTTRTKIKTLENPMVLDRLKGVGAACGVKTTGIRPKRSILSVPTKHGKNYSLHNNHRSSGRA